MPPGYKIIYLPKLLIVSLYCFALHTAYAQTNTSSAVILSRKIISTDQGLASREVFCGTQDNDGFIWFGTRNGLNRYDGKNFLLFTRQHNGMQDNKVVQLATDNDNHLFIAYGATINARALNGRVDVMDLATHQVKRITEVLGKMPFKESDITWLSGDGTGNIIWVTRNPYRVWQYDQQKGFKLRIEIGNNIPGMDTTVAFSDYTARNSLFRYGFMVLAIAPGRWYFVDKHTVLPFTIIGNQAVVGIDQQKNMLLLDRDAGNKLIILQVDGKINRQIIPGTYNLDSVVNKTWREVSGTIGENAAVFSDPQKGVYLWKNNTFSQVLGKDEMKGFIASYYTFTDKKGDNWICTSEGVIQVNTRRNNFRQYFSKNEFTALGYNSVRGIYADNNNNIFAGIAGALCTLDANGQNAIYPVKGLAYALLPGQERLLVSASRLYSFDRSKKVLNELPADQPSTDAEIWSLYAPVQNKLLIGGSVNIFIYDELSGKMLPVSYASGEMPRAKFTYRFFKGADNYTWAVASTGLYRLNKNNLVTDYYGTQAGTHHTLPFSDISDMYDEGNGTAWLATNGEGLLRWEEQANRFRQFSITEGLPSNTLYRIEADEAHNLWISSDNGLFRFNPATFSVNRYTINDGIADNEFNRISSFKAKDGRMFFGGLNGITAFYPRDFAVDTESSNAPLRVTGFSQFSASGNQLEDNADAVIASKKITLQPGDKFFTLEFQLLDYLQTEAHRYAYRIDGVDKDWNYLNANSIRISGLAYGKYTLHIKGESAGGTWSRNELAIALVVLKPFYRQAWFIIACVLLGIALIYLLYRWRTVSLFKEKTFLEQTVHTRTGELREMVAEKEVLLKEVHHRVKNNLQVISALLEMQGSRTDDPGTKAAIRESQNRVLSIAFIHQNLYQQQDIKIVEIRAFVDELAGHLHQVFARPGFNLLLENNMPETFLDIDTAVPLGLIINELITNSYKYAFAGRKTGKVQVNLTQSEPGIYAFSYRDDGIGLPAGFNIQQSQSLGLRLVQQLCKQLAGKLEYIYRDGSHFFFTLKDLDTRNKSS